MSCVADAIAINRPTLITSAKFSVGCIKLAIVQAGLLDAAAAMVAPGGILMYVTCSLQPEEGPDPVGKFLKRHPAFSRDPIDAAALPGLPEAITADGDLRTLPHHLGAVGGMDGFFVARLQKAP